MAQHSPFWSDGFYDTGEPSEYSWGSGLGHARCAAPEDGGLYCGTSPGVAPDRTGQGGFCIPGRQVRT